MKSIYYGGLLFSALLTLLFTTSCSNRVFPKETLEMNYTMKMTSEHQREIKANVRIFYSEKDVKLPYEVISVNRYSPWFSIPIFYPHDKQVEKKYLKNAVETAYKQGANGIIVLTPMFYQAIVIKSLDSVNENAAEQKSVVFDTTLSSKFSSGEIYKMLPKNIKQYVRSFNDELSTIAEYVSNYNELKFFMYKVNVLEAYYRKSKTTNKDVVGKLDEYKLIAYESFCDEISSVIRKASTTDELLTASEMINNLEEQYKLNPVSNDDVTKKVEDLIKKIEKTRSKIEKKSKR